MDSLVIVPMEKGRKKTNDANPVIIVAGILLLRTCIFLDIKKVGKQTKNTL